MKAFRDILNISKESGKRRFICIEVTHYQNLFVKACYREAVKIIFNRHNEKK